jgi:hypothetical protein
MHFTTNSKKLSSHQLKSKIHFITVHIIRIKPFIDTVKKSSKKNLSYFMSAIKSGWSEQSQVNKGKFDSLICIFYINGIK